VQKVSRAGADRARPKAQSMRLEFFGSGLNVDQAMIEPDLRPTAAAEMRWDPPTSTLAPSPRPNGCQRQGSSCSRRGRLRDSAQDPVLESFVLTDHIHCTGGSDQARIGIGTLASGGIHGATHRTIARRRPTIGPVRRERAYICRMHWVAGGACSERRARILR
jgi:hypothetical protein